MKHLIITGAREHNLKGIDLKLPRDKLIVFSGLSGSGKSSLAFDTIYAEGQRRYVESLSAYARQFLGLMKKPDVENIEGLSPAISIDQKTTSKNPRSTVGTVTEIYDYFRLLFARIGTPYCPEHAIKIEPQSPQKIARRIKEEFEGDVLILAPIVRQKKGTYEKLLEDLHNDGYARARVNKKIIRTHEKIALERYKKHDIEVVVDRLHVDDDARLIEACEQTIEKSEGLLIVLQGDEEKLYSAKLSCPECDIQFEELQPRMFSFNSPFGACRDCDGLGFKMEFDPDLIIPDKSKALAGGAIKVFRNHVDGWRIRQLGRVARNHGFSMICSVNELSEEAMGVVLYGGGAYEGVIPMLDRLYQQTDSESRRNWMERFMRIHTCPSCGGKRLKPKILSVKVGEKSIIDLTDMPISESLAFFDQLELTGQQRMIARHLLKEIRARLSFLDQVGLSYLTLSRTASTLSGGESQRIRLATQIGSNLTGVLYILDEPSIGLHQRDNEKLLQTLLDLRDLGNTLIVVEHDEDTLRTADVVVDIGPGAGIHGGEILFNGSPEQLLKNGHSSLTGKYLSGALKIPVPEIRREPQGFIEIKGAREHNLKHIDVSIPAGCLTLVTGVSGSGKSTLIDEILYKALRKELHNSRDVPGRYDTILYEGKVDKVIEIDQSPIGRTPRSNPATYTKIFDHIRKLFSETKEARLRGYRPGRFSFNVKGGRCEACRGDGTIRIEMNFLPDVYVDCEECNAKRYNEETLSIQYKARNIADVLDMSVEEALTFFQNVPPIKRKLQVLSDVGLDYIKLGQSSVTLSGGESQRIKLTRELSKMATGKTLYLLDEPTTGLHFHDVKKLLKVLNRLVDKGNSVVVIEHNLDVIKNADYIIDLGPEGGEKGGRIIAEGTPEQVMKNPDSYTGEYLKRHLGKKETESLGK